MFRKIRVSLLRAKREQAGQAFVIVLILMLLGGLIIAPLLAFMGTGLKSGQVFEKKTTELYAADAGIEDGIWQVQYDELQSLTDPGPYSAYDYSTTWNFELDEQVNEKDVTGTVGNVWIPTVVDVEDLPSESALQATIEGVGGESPKALVTGKVPDTGEYQIRITYNKEQEDEFLYGDEFQIEEIGIWLPPGFEYVAGSSNLEADPYADYYSVPVVSAHAGGKVVVWNFSSVPLALFPGVQPSDVPMVTQVTFEFTSLRPAMVPDAVSWVDTNMDLGGGIHYTWDADTKIFKVTSQAGDTALEAYTAKGELRQMAGARPGDYYATGNSLMGGDPTYRDELYEKSSATIDTSVNPDYGIPSDATVAAAYLYWTGWIDWHGYEPSAGGSTIVFYDECSNFNNWNNPGNDWVISSGRFRGHHLGSAEYRFLTLQSSLDLSSYSDKLVTVSWSQWESSYFNNLETNDYLYFAFSGDGGSTWSADIEAFHDDIGTTPQSFSYTIPQQYLTANFKMRFYLGDETGWVGNDEYCYLDDITISVSNAIFADDCADFSAPQVDWSNGSDWLVVSGAFEGHHRGGSTDRYLTMSDSVNLSSYAGQTLSVSWEQWENGSLEDYGGYKDTLYFAFSGDGGNTWSADIEAFNGNIGSSPQQFSYPIPDQYLTSGFRMRFYLGDSNGFTSYDEYAYIDNIVIAKGGGSLEYPDNPTAAKLKTLVEETARVNKVTFASTVTNTVTITADRWQILETVNPPGYNMFDGQWSYSCYKDVTNLVKQWVEDDDVSDNGAGTYTLGHVVAVNEKDPDYVFDFVLGGETGYPLGTPAPAYHESRHQACYAGWSLILIYTSAATKGHQLYLYDDYIYAWHSDPDFDDDGSPGGSIGGFLVPDPIEDETVAAKITAFVGEGDNAITGDYFRIRVPPDSYHNLSNTVSPAYNVWNSNSPGLAIPGVDIDTFNVLWTDGILAPDDTNADVSLLTDDDGFWMIYVILSFRSDTVAGGTISYLIRS
jgi:hypothetical protein